MEEQRIETGYANGNSPLSEATGNMTAVKDKVSEQANEIKNRLSSQANQWGSQLGEKINQARGKTSVQLRNTSQRIQHLADYVEKNDAKDMSDALLTQSQQVVRKHPGKSLLGAMVIGFLVGRMFMKMR